jgi:hypothetical protein
MSTLLIFCDGVILPAVGLPLFTGRPERSERHFRPQLTDESAVRCDTGIDESSPAPREPQLTNRVSGILASWAIKPRPSKVFAAPDAGHALACAPLTGTGQGDGAQCCGPPTLLRRWRWRRQQFLARQAARSEGGDHRAHPHRMATNRTVDALARGNAGFHLLEGDSVILAVGGRDQPHQ